MDNQLLEKIKSELQSSMSEFRYNHSIAVMEKAVELARIYGVNEEEAALAGLCHDIAKEIPDSEAFEIANNNGIEFDEIEKTNRKLIHGKIGAFIVKDRFGLNENIQNAIKYHTTTDKSMNILAKIIFVADKIADGRKRDEQERKLAYEDIDKAMILIINNTLEYLLKENKLIHTKEVETRNYLILNGG